MSNPKETVLELCAGGGGQTIGLSKAGLDCVGAVEIDADACDTLRHNKRKLSVHNADLREFDARTFEGVDVVSGGVPCPPFSIAGKQLGADDERDLFPEALRVVRECRPRAVMFENVRGFASAKFTDYREKLLSELRHMGYEAAWRLISASDFKVSQLRPRFILIGLQSEYAPYFRWPAPRSGAPTVGECLIDLMAAGGWAGAEAWAEKANKIAPTIVGGSKKHGGPDLGPSRAKRAWLELGVIGSSIANEAPDADFPIDGLPKLTNRMVARIQSFPDSWTFKGKKTSQYRQIGNAFPPKVAQALGTAIKKALRKTTSSPKARGELFEAELIAGA